MTKARGMEMAKQKIHKAAIRILSILRILIFRILIRILIFRILIILDIPSPTFPAKILSNCVAPTRFACRHTLTGQN